MPLPARDRKIKKRTGFGSHPGRRNRQTNGGSRRAAIATLSGSSSVASSAGAPIATIEKSKSGQVLVRIQRGQNQTSRPFFQGVCQEFCIWMSATTPAPQLAQDLEI